MGFADPWRRAGEAVPSHGAPLADSVHARATVAIARPTPTPQDSASGATKVAQYHLRNACLTCVACACKHQCRCPVPGKDAIAPHPRCRLPGSNLGRAPGPRSVRPASPVGHVATSSPTRAGRRSPHGAFIAAFDVPPVSQTHRESPLEAHPGCQQFPTSSDRPRADVHLAFGIPTPFLWKTDMFCASKDLLTESDVEQKLLWPLLTSSAPTGAGLLPADVLTKLSIRRLEIGKGTSKKLYYPDYMVVLAGLPVLVLEAKAPGEPLGQALNEARLYGNELNALFPTGINPCIRVIACNGHELFTSPLDTSEPDLTLRLVDICLGSILYTNLIDKCQRATLQKYADEIRRRFRKPHYRRAVSQIGGASFQNEELAPNTFGSTIVGDYGHIFKPNPTEHC